MSTGPCLIVDVSEAQEWGAAFPPDRGAVQVAGIRPTLIPPARRPTILQPDRPTAETEAKRLALLHPSARFMLFEAGMVAMATSVPSHVTISGRVWDTRRVAVLVELDNDQVPF